MKQSDTVKKLAMAGVLTAVAVVGSLLSFPIFGSKCAPVQHMVNILAAVVLGPGWGVGIAFCASLLRNLLGLGSLMAFPGSMIGALCCGLAYMAFRKLWLMGLNPGGLFVYIVPFLVSTVVGSILAYFLVTALQKGGVISMYRHPAKKEMKMSQ